MATLTDDDRNELLLSCRYGDLEDVQQFVEKFGPEALAGVRDENGNTVLHMICGNGHTGDHLLLLCIICNSVSIPIEMFYRFAGLYFAHHTGLSPL